MKRVLIVTPNDLQTSSPQILHLAEALREKGAEVTLTGPVSPVVSMPGTHLCRISRGRLRNVLTVLAALMQASFRRCDLMIGFDEVGRIPCLLAACIRPELKAVLYNLEYFEDQRGSRCQELARALFRHLRGKAALIIDANEDRVRLRAKLSGQVRLAAVHNAAPLNDPAVRPPEDPIYHGIGRDRVRLVYTGCKNHTVAKVIRALKRVASPVHLFVVGEISSEYQEALQESGCGGRVTLTGLVPRERLPGILAWADVGVSLYGSGPDSFAAQRMCAPNKIYEYMSWGLPSICSDNPPLVRLVQKNGWGLCIPPGDESKIAEAIEMLAGDRQLRAAMSAKAVALHKGPMNYAEQVKPILELL